MHEIPTPRGAGIGLAIGVLVGLWSVPGGVGWPIWVGVIGYAALGAWDDFKRRPAILRLIAQVILATIVVASLSMQENGYAALALGVLFLCGVVNAVNFMDGINGITALHAIVWGVTFTVALAKINCLELIPVAAAMSAVGIAFLPWNSPRARMFLGDSGSYLIGAMVGILAVEGSLSGHPVAFIGPLAIYGADTGFTLVKRALRRERLDEAHRSHVYQQLAMHGWGHMGAAAVTAGFSAVTACLAVATIGSPVYYSVGAVAAIVALCAVYLSLPTATVKYRKLTADRRERDA